MSEKKKTDVLVNTGEAMVHGKVYLPPVPDLSFKQKNDLFAQAFADLISDEIKNVLSKDSGPCRPL